MNFIEAVAELEWGKKLRRRNWGDGNYITYSGGKFIWRNDSSSIFEIDNHDIKAIDWEIYKEKPKTYSFQEAFKALKAARPIMRMSNKKIFTYKNLFYDKIFSHDDIVATDWIILD